MLQYCGINELFGGLLMELYQQILAKILSKETIQITFPQLKINAAAIVELQCYKALQMIQEILKHDTLEDEACL